MANEAQQTIQMTAVQGQPILVKVVDQSGFWQSYQVPISSFLLLLTACIAWMIQLHVANKNHALERLKFLKQQFDGIVAKISNLSDARLHVHRQKTRRQNLFNILNGIPKFKHLKLSVIEEIEDDINSINIELASSIGKLASAYLDATSLEWVSDSQKKAIEADLRKDCDLESDPDENYGDRIVYEVFNSKLETLAQEMARIESSKTLDPLTSMALYILDKLESQRGA